MQQRAEDDRKDRVRQHIGAVIQHGVRHGGQAADAHEAVLKIFRVDRDAAQEVDHEAADAAEKRAEGERAALPLRKRAAHEPGEADEHVGHGIVEQHALPVDRGAAGEEVFQRSEHQPGQQAPAEPAVDREQDQRDHDEVDAAAEAAEGQPDGDLQITQGDRERDEDGALRDAAEILVFHGVCSFP